MVHAPRTTWRLLALAIILTMPIALVAGLSCAWSLSCQTGHVRFLARDGSVYFWYHDGASRLDSDISIDFHENSRVDWLPVTQVWRVAGFGTVHQASFPLWIPYVTTVLLVAVFLRKFRRSDASACWQCGYQCRTSRVCSECGAPVRARRYPLSRPS